MKITRRQLRQIIKEEVSKAIHEVPAGPPPRPTDVKPNSAFEELNVGNKSAWVSYGVTGSQSQAESIAKYVLSVTQFSPAAVGAHIEVSFVNGKFDEIKERRGDVLPSGIFKDISRGIRKQVAKHGKGLDGSIHLVLR